MSRGILRRGIFSLPASYSEAKNSRETLAEGEEKMENTYRKTEVVEQPFCESGTEYILPDYLGDIKKLLSSEARVIPSGKFVGGGEAQFAGIVEYTVLYLDKEGKLSSTVFTSDYELVCPTPEDSLIYADADVRLSNLSVRVTGPRKISARCAISCRVLRCESASYEVGGDALEGAELERYERAVPIRYTTEGATFEREYAEEAERFEGKSVEELEILSSGGAVRIDEVRPVAGGVMITGEIEIGALLRTPDMASFAVRKTIPFEELVSIEEATGEGSATADAFCSSVHANLQSTEDGCALAVSAIVEYHATLEENRELLLLEDAYAVGRETKNVYERFSYEELIETRKVQIPLHAELPRAECDAERVREIPHAALSARVSGVELVEEGVKVTVEAAFTLLGCEVTEAGEAIYAPYKLTVTNEQLLPLSLVDTEGVKVWWRAAFCGVKGMLDAASLSADAILQLSLVLTRERSARVLKSCSFAEGEPSQKESCEITVYYPERGETLWQVAKRFRVSVSDIAKRNSLSESVAAMGAGGALDGIERLLLF